MAATRGADVARERHLVVVATQTLEVGADIDAEYLVTEACGVRALTQRLGRLNRLGHHSHARAVYVHAPPPKRRGRASRGEESESWPVYGEEPARVLERLESACADGDDHTVNLQPARVAEVLGAPGDDPGRAPEVLPGILWEWTKTTTRPDGEAPVEPYFSGIQGAEYSVSIIWRVHVPEEGQRLWPRASDREAVDAADTRGAGCALQDGEDVHRLGARRDDVGTDPCTANLRPGDQIVLAADRGLLDRFGWNPAASDPVVDASLAGAGIAARREGDRAAVRHRGDAAAGDRARERMSRTRSISRSATRLWKRSWLRSSPPNLHPDGATREWGAFTQALRPAVERPRA